VHKPWQIGDLALYYENGCRDTKPYLGIIRKVLGRVSPGRTKITVEFFDRVKFGPHVCTYVDGHTDIGPPLTDLENILWNFTK
jgi:hypothetical protein